MLVEVGRPNDDNLQTKTQQQTTPNAESHQTV